MSDVSWATGSGVARPPTRREAPPPNLADLLERILDKGIVIVGDIKVNLLDIELLTIKIRLLIASADRAKEMGIDWWEHDPALSSSARQDVLAENHELRERIARLEKRARRPIEPAEPHPRPTAPNRSSDD
jgi:hypothetical protein